MVRQNNILFLKKSSELNEINVDVRDYFLNRQTTA